MKSWISGLTLILVSSGVNVLAGETNRAIEQWQDFAKHSGKSQHQRWLAAIMDPKAINLAKRWKDLRGYDAHDKIDGYTLPAELKAGLTINKGNLIQYPWLSDYLPRDVINSLAAEKGYVREITIVPTNTYYMNEGVLDATLAVRAKQWVPTTNENSTLVNSDGTATLLNDETAAAIPFLHPQDGLELNWSFVAHGVGTETLVFDPMISNSCDGEGKLDVQYEGLIWWQKFHGRQRIKPLGSIADKDQFVEGGSLFVLSPNDVSGIAAVRQRAARGDESDDFRIFLPSNRRTRVLSGNDAQDPMYYGLEVSWDDWRAYWAKTDLQTFDYNLVGEKLILASPETGYIYRSANMADSQCAWNSMEMELRPVWVLEIKDKKGVYQYKTRTLYIDQENYYAQYQEMTDQRDQPYRTWDDSRSWRPFDGDAQWDHITVHNQYNNRLNIITITPVWDDRDKKVTEEYFDIDQLRDL
ncbi:MAG: outer membrane lipoprotein-sorting protein [Cycloclasticus sp.]|nr:outer membrane lipoprotein-sorting protein [Cycloclasticus sp.]MBQ0789432.1 outer membrane lipoprotein-sorting protein [Cycloclasticus sp.]